MKIDTPESRSDMERDLLLILWKLTRIFQQARGGAEAKENAHVSNDFDVYMSQFSEVRAV